MLRAGYPLMAIYTLGCCSIHKVEMLQQFQPSLESLWDLQSAPRL